MNDKISRILHLIYLFVCFNFHKGFYKVLIKYFQYMYLCAKIIDKL
nr:MAG TPA: hypothetical protein [Crassvirales sp.]